MKTLKLLWAIILGATLLTSCVAEVIIEDDIFIEEPVFNLNGLLNTYEIWYVDIERTQGNGEIPFLQKAFTVSFKNGAFYANNNLVGMGSNGNGFGLNVGYYDAFSTEVTISHDINGGYRLDVTRLNANEIKLYDRITNTSYYLIGYQRSTFDYEKVFYDNIHYFLHEYTTWEKVYTSQFGALNEFDNENYLQFLYEGSGDNFRSSEDVDIANINTIYYDYTGYYSVQDAANNEYMKNLTLDYDYLGNEYFELTVINDNRIALVHAASGTTYEFLGRGYLQFKSSKNEKLSQNNKKRIKESDLL